MEYTSVYITKEGGILMHAHYNSETVQQTKPREDVDDLIFRASPERPVSDR